MDLQNCFISHQCSAPVLADTKSAVKSNKLDLSFGVDWSFVFGSGQLHGALGAAAVTPVLYLVRELCEECGKIKIRSLAYKDVGCRHYLLVGAAISDIA